MASTPTLYLVGICASQVFVMVVELRYHRYKEAIGLENGLSILLDKVFGQGVPGAQQVEDFSFAQLC